MVVLSLSLCTEDSRAAHGSWNTFTGEDRVNETNMMQMADALLSTGMAEAGYDTVNVVCNGWTGRDPDHTGLG